jgi:hypothetical protein
MSQERQPHEKNKRVPIVSGFIINGVSPETGYKELSLRLTAIVNAVI